MGVLLSKVTDRDIVLAVRGGGEWLDHFEDAEVIEALGKLVTKCPTYVAIGHADDELEMLEDIVLKTFHTPGTAIHELDGMLQKFRARRSVEAEAEVATSGATGAPKAPPAASPPKERQSEPRSTDPRSAAPCTETPRPEPAWHEAYRSPATPAAAVSHGAPRGRLDDRLELLRTLGLLALGLVLLVLSAVGLHLATSRRPTVTSLLPARKAIEGGHDPKRARGGEQTRVKDRKEATPAHVVRALRDLAPANQSVPAPVSGSATEAAAAAVTAPAPHAARAQVATTDEAATTAALRAAAALLAPFEMGRTLEAARGRCAERYGMWLGGAARCRLPGGREYQFGVAGELVQAITVRQVGGAPVPLLSETTLSALQALHASGRGPWILHASPRQLTVQPRPHPPGL
jgi:hypothetical protein